MQSVHMAGHTGAHHNGTKTRTHDLDKHAAHSSRCGLGGGFLAQHNAIRDTLATDVSNILGRQMLTEQNPIQDLDDNRRPDMVFVAPTGETKHLDVCICHSHSGVPSTHIPGHLIIISESRKINKYPELDLIPIVFENRGRPGTYVRQFLQLVTRHLTTQERAIQMSIIWQNLSCTLQRHNYIMMSSAGPLIKITDIQHLLWKTPRPHISLDNTTNLIQFYTTRRQHRCTNSHYTTKSHTLLYVIPAHLFLLFGLFAH